MWLGEQSLKLGHIAYIGSRGELGTFADTVDGLVIPRGLA